MPAASLVLHDKAGAAQQRRCPQVITEKALVEQSGSFEQAVMSNDKAALAGFCAGKAAEAAPEEGGGLLSEAPYLFRVTVRIGLLLGWVGTPCEEADGLMDGCVCVCGCRGGCRCTQGSEGPICRAPGRCSGETDGQP